MRRGEMARGVSAMLTLSPYLRRAELTGILAVKKGSATLISGGASREVPADPYKAPGAPSRPAAAARPRSSLDGSGILIDENTEIAITVPVVSPTCAKNGTAGVAIDKLAVKLVKGRIYGGLASHYEIPANCRP